MGRQSNQPIARRRDLQPPEKFPADFPIAAVPMALADHFAQHVTVRGAGQSEIVSLPASECRDASGPSRLQAECLDPGPKTFANFPLPDPDWHRGECCRMPRDWIGLRQRQFNLRAPWRRCESALKNDQCKYDCFHGFGTWCFDTVTAV